MLKETDLTFSLSKQAYKQVMHYQIQRMYELEHLAYTTDVPVIILFEGWDAAGKGTAICRLTERLDPRGFKVLPTQAPRTHEMQKPWLWRFWMQIPRRGQMAIFDRSWYGRVLVERVQSLTPIPDWIRAYEEINEFERTLADDGIVMVKFWLHISQRRAVTPFYRLDPGSGHGMASHSRGLGESSGVRGIRGRRRGYDCQHEYRGCTMDRGARQRHEL